MRTRFLILLLLLCPTLFAEPVYNGFSGGMMLHTGYMFGKKATLPHNPEGATIGVGGVLRINLWKHLRIGGEGYVSTMNSSLTTERHNLQSGSYIRNGYGGFLADAYWRWEKTWLYLGATIGGGAMRSLYISDGSESDWLPENKAIFNRQAYFMFDPFIGVDFVLTQRIHLTLKVDYLLPIHHNTLLTPAGPRLYFGVLFCH